ncbi:MAG: AzlC family ABC transporter permease [Alphaproteobacteria bacterium]|nr:AzlC family ABC transporter permease [Alphaproteobacteria bacterium]
MSEKPVRAPEPVFDSGLVPYPNRLRAFWGGWRDAVGLPAAVLFSSTLGFGSIASKADYPLSLAVLSVFTIWGLPGQIAMVELFAVGASILPIAVAAAGANARFLPMTVSLLPLFRGSFRSWNWTYLMAHLISINTWIALTRRGPSLPLDQRPHYFVGFSLLCMFAGAAGTALGYLLAGALPRTLTLGLVFLSPIYFLMVFSGVRERGGVLAVLLGAVAGPLLHMTSPEWGVPATGFLAGTAAFLLDRKAFGRG